MNAISTPCSVSSDNSDLSNAYQKPHSITITVDPNYVPAKATPLVERKLIHGYAQEVQKPPLQTFLGDGTNGPQFSDELIEKGTNRERLEEAFTQLEDQFAAQGKTLLYLWPSTLKTEWIDQTGQRGFTIIDSTHPALEQLKAVYSSDKMANGTPRHDVSAWRAKTENYRGDLNGERPFIHHSDRTKARFNKFTAAHVHAVLEGKPLATQIQYLRLMTTVDSLDNLIDRLIEERKSWHKALLEVLSDSSVSLDSIRNKYSLNDSQIQELKDLSTQLFDPERVELLKMEIKQYERIQSKREEQREHFSTRWALTHPLAGNHPTELAESFRSRVQELQSEYRAEEGAIRPGYFTEKSLFKKRTHELSAEEVERSLDTAALAISLPDDPSKEQIVLQNLSSKKSASPLKIKQDSLALVMVKTTKAIDSGLASPGSQLTESRPFEELVIELSLRERQFLKYELNQEAERLKDKMNQLRPAAFADFGRTHPDCSASLDNFCHLRQLSGISGQLHLQAALPL